MSTEFTTEGFRAVLAKAFQHLDELCAGRARFRMSIPADEDRDSDLIFSAALSLAEEAIAEIERLTRELDAQKFAAKEYQLQINAFTDPDPEAFRQFIRREIRIQGGAPW